MLQNNPSLCHFPQEEVTDYIFFHMLNSLDYESFTKNMLQRSRAPKNLQIEFFLHIESNLSSKILERQMLSMF